MPQDLFTQTPLTINSLPTRLVQPSNLPTLPPRSR
jgi:hypothetical protein